MCLLWGKNWVFIFHLENLKYYIALIGWTLLLRRNVSPMRYELGFYIPEDGIFHSDRRLILKYYNINLSFKAYYLFN
jgi:hypothetical protein